jgi:hypothetical protein
MVCTAVMLANACAVGVSVPSRTSLKVFPIKRVAMLKTGGGAK